MHSILRCGKTPPRATVRRRSQGARLFQIKIGALPPALLRPVDKLSARIPRGGQGSAFRLYRLRSAETTTRPTREARGVRFADAPTKIAGRPREPARPGRISTNGGMRYFQPTMARLPTPHDRDVRLRTHGISQFQRVLPGGPANPHQAEGLGVAHLA